MWLISHLVYQMGYGSRALQLLQMYYEGKFPTMDESTGLNHSEITSVSSEVIQRKQTSVSQRSRRRDGIGYLSDRGPAVFPCDAGCESVGGGRHSTEGAPSSASEAQWEESRAAGLPGSFIRHHHTAAEVKTHQAGNDKVLMHEFEYWSIILHHFRFWKKAGYSPVYLRQTPVRLFQLWLFRLVGSRVLIYFCVCVCLEWPDRRTLLCDAKGAEYRWSFRPEPVADRLLDRWNNAAWLHGLIHKLHAYQHGFCFSLRFPSSLPLPALLPVQQFPPQSGADHPAE